MQETRQRILEILKVRKYRTVNELSQELGLTAVTIRHHLEVLRSEGLIAPPRIQRKGGPGRPQHIYYLAEEAESYFPKNYDRLAQAILTELEEIMSAQEMENLMSNVAQRLADQAGLSKSGDLATRLKATLAYLNDAGYLAAIEQESDQILLHIANCPYEQVARYHQQPCYIDRQMIAHLTSMEIERLENIAEGDDTCTYILSQASP